MPKIIFVVSMCVYVKLRDCRERECVCVRMCLLVCVRANLSLSLFFVAYIFTLWWFNESCPFLFVHDFNLAKKVSK